MFALDMEQSAGLMRRAHEAYAVAVRHRQPAATPSTVPQRADRPPERRIDHQLLRALRAVATRQAGREVCQEIQQKQP
ncbi:hypothetical protein [Krasilnikovia sp. MM14-A1004]|uniref:hypothetical protein n=1 Tax=Krasilnikovia sp. MM14-A1004 TaxID=3373541 RepID=UPI00399D376B